MTRKWVSLLTSGDNNPSYHFQMSVSSSLLGSASSLQLEIYDRDLAVRLALRIRLAMQGTQVSSLAGELRFHMPLAYISGLSFIILGCRTRLDLETVLQGAFS